MPFQKMVPAQNFGASFQPQTQYQNLRDDDLEDDEHRGFISQARSEKLESFSKSRPQRILRSPIFVAFIALQSLTFISLVVSVFVHNLKPSELRCARQLSPYSPYLETDDLEYEHFTLENHLMQPSPYRGLPTPELEDAWIKLWRYPKVHFPQEKLVVLNKTVPEQYSRAAPQFGDDVLGFFSVFHHLHCLDLVRQYTYRNDYDYSNVTAFRSSEQLLRGHVDHCIETLRKAIMCTSDVTPVVFIDDPSRDAGFKTDFNIVKTCRNFQKVQEWVINNRGDV